MINETNGSSINPLLKLREAGKVVPESLAKKEEETTILDEAKGLVYGDRNKAYDHPIDNFNNIADLWNGYMHIKYRKAGGVAGLNNVDIACLNILQKVARLANNNTHRDSIIDIAGYAATVERIIDKK